MTTSPNADTPLAPPSRQLNLLQILALFAFILGGVLVGLHKLDALSDPVEVVDRMYRDGLAAQPAREARALAWAPVLSDAAQRRLDQAASVRRLAGQVEFRDTTLRGLFLVEDGAHVVLRDVTVEGTILSLAAMQGRAPAPSTLVLEGGVTFVAGDDLPGLAVWLPGGSVLAEDPDSYVGIDGDVVARRVELAGEGDLVGTVYAPSAPELAADVRVSARDYDVVPAPSLARDDSALLSFEFPR